MPYNDPHFPDFLAGPPRPPIGPEEGPWYDRAAPGCDDQLAMFSRVGRGMKGDSYKVVINSDSDMETYLEGMSYDEASGTWASEWISENINGGRLDYLYNLRPYTMPQTFTITFRYRRPNRDPWQWVWTTPAIPYIWDADNDGFGDVDGIVGVGVGTLFLKKTQDSWVTTNLPTSYTIAEALTRQEKLLYPVGWTRELLNAPIPGDPYTVNLTYGIGGDFDAPNIEDLARILGMTVNHIRYLAANGTLPTTDPLNQNENLRQYIDRRDIADLNHIHQDMGFGGGATVDSDGNITYISNNTHFTADGSNGSAGKWKHPIKVDKGSTTGDTTSTATTVKGYIDEGDKILRDRIKNLEDANGKLKDALQALINNIYGAGTVNLDANGDPTGTVTLNVPGKIAIGKLNVFTNVNGSQSTTTIKNASGTSDITVDPNYIMTRDPANGDTRSI